MVIERDHHAQQEAERPDACFYAHYGLPIDAEGLGKLRLGLASLASCTRDIIDQDVLHKSIRYCSQKPRSSIPGGHRQEIAEQSSHFVHTNLK
ncbi:hypothetical protein GCM10011349_46500 [Novosphingobium indicum]|uniref:Uncharacterized protein n=1 Tax=Novosphingobium indicum TaxID=462949 RepID=A0ABQ2K0C2_9SPHN|nr:hypothetical protein GCM10011349_46500 [Novosphingobium indicum]